MGAVPASWPAPADEEFALPDVPTPVAARRRAVRPRDAASLIIVRPGADGPEVLMGMRGARHRFMPNRLVFPGGRVDPDDRRGRFATPLRPDTLAHLRPYASMLVRASGPEYVEDMLTALRV